MSFKLGFNLQFKELEEEVKLLKNLSHPNIVVFDELPHYWFACFLTLFGVIYECKICLKVHNNERDYLSHLHAHFQEKKFRDEMKTENTSDNDLYDSEFSEPPHLSKWFPDYVYESPMLDTCYGFEFSDLKESESIKDLVIKKETPTKIDDLVSSKIDDMTDSQAAYSELVVEDSVIDDAVIDKNRRSLFRRVAKRKPTIPTVEEELTYLKNRVSDLEDKVSYLYDVISRLIISNGNNGN
ncbi:unnamed protein product [Arabidopsis lyrata]|uniref:C2H2-type domain-containing protein n=2 Tax=Arabidopsis lyrata subsp. lyrata TaxID=81972 RepID=D7MAY6_ARALL|nr:hypothetical protein ARALYDRAFT_355279 [Arabidopsis lyrata subsp. lyrata]CAH8276613.1 unnamed protein product [Arabidopsis lyrata]